jgi:ferrous-iron efflux pump FieF
VGTLLLGAVKLLVGLASGSQAVVASAADSLGDAVISGVNLLMMRQAAMPPDEGHPWGHGKAEALASLAQAVALSAVVGWIVVQGVNTLVGRGESPPDTGPALAVMAVSMLGSAAISWHLGRAARSTGSLVLSADAVHYRMDLFTGAAVVIGLLAAWFTGWAEADAVASLVVSALMAREVWALGKEAIDELMDRPLPEEEAAQVANVLSAFGPRIRSWHDLRTRRSGPSRFVQVHVVLPPEISFAEAHRVTDDVEEALRAAIANLDVLVHADPDGEHDQTDDVRA